MWRFIKISFVVLTVAITLLWLGNSSRFIDVPSAQKPRLLAHRGVHQIYTGADRTAQTCRAHPIRHASHSYIENTRPSIAAAFAAGADVVEIDVHLTTDHVFAVFHDWTLDCLTNGTGVTRKQDFATLRQLDLGYGYSHDGVTFPLRGKALPMPSLTEVLTAFPDQRFLINFKSNAAEEARHMAARLNAIPHETQVFGVYGGARPTQDTIAAVDGLKGYDRQSLKSCLIRYLAIGWSGMVPKACENMLIAIPMDYAPYFWGWPHRFTARMKAAGTTVILLGPYDNRGFSSGIDDLDTLARVPEQFDGYLWTNRIELIGPQLETE
jgi:glycerophosphoryl diester phosphodiesterase